MPYLDELFQRQGVQPFGNSQCWEGTVARTGDDGIFITVPGFDPGLLWGPCSPASATAKVGDHVAVALSDDGTPWLLSVGGGGGDSDGGDGNVDGGFPDSVYGGLPLIDGNGINRS